MSTLALIRRKTRYTTQLKHGNSVKKEVAKLDNKHNKISMSLKIGENNFLLIFLFLTSSP